MTAENEPAGAAHPGRDDDVRIDDTTLSANHRRMLEVASGIDPAVVSERGYSTETSGRALRRLGFADSQCRVPALVLPLRNTDGEIAGYQIRPDRPRVLRGKAIKYETPRGSRMVLDVPPRARPMLGDPHVPLWVTEGVKKGDALASRGACAVALIGVWNWRGSNEHGGKTALAEWERIALHGRRVYVVFDSDVAVKPEVAKALERLKGFLESRKAEVAIIYLPGGASGAKVGVDDYLAQGHAIDDLVRLARRELLRPEKEDEDRPTVRLGPDMARVIDEAERALLQTKSEIFARGPAVVTVTRDRAELPGSEVLAGTPSIAVLSDGAVRERMSTAARFVVREGEDESEVLPPEWAVRSYLARPEHRLRPLRGIVSHPIFRSDGSLATAPGYDARTGLYLDTEGLDLTLPARPTREDALRAAEILAEPLVDFPFIGDVDRSATLAAILTVLSRLDHGGAIPCYAIDATTRGSGKGLLVDTVAIVATGREPPRRSQCDSEEEWRKRILAVALSGVAVYLLDNQETCLRSGALAAAWTCRAWSDRLLGQSRDVSAPLDCVWFLTANNLQLAGDLPRRIIPIRLDPGVERPEERTGFRHPDLLDHVRRERARYLGAALTVLLAHRLAGSPQPDRTLYPRIGSYESWDSLVRAALLWLDLPDPCAGRLRLQEDSDLGREEIHVALSAWHEALGGDPFTVAEVLERAKWTPDLAEALRGICPPRKDGREEIEPSALGYALRRHRGRVVAGLRLVRDPARATGNRARWRVSAVAEPKPDGMDGMDGIIPTLKGSGGTHTPREEGDRGGGVRAEAPPSGVSGWHPCHPVSDATCGACIPCRAGHREHCARFGPR